MVVIQMLSNRAYDIIKWLITIGLPAVGAFYLAIGKIWNLPHIVGVNGTINTTIVFLGLLIGYSGRQYKKTEGAPDGDLIVAQDGDSKYLALGINTSIDEMTAKDTVVLKVVEKGSISPD